MRRNHNGLKSVILLVFVCLFLMACTAAVSQQDDALDVLVLPALTAVDLQNTQLQVVATTSIIGDAVAQVGGDAIVLTTLMGAGQDPHSYVPSAGDLTAVADAHVIFINGWNLEEGLLDNLQNVAGEVPLVPVSANIAPLAFGAHEDEAESDHETADPHTWLDPHLVKQWVRNIAQTLSALDPDKATLYTANADAYQAELDALIKKMETQIVTIPVAQRVLVTNQDSLAYFAARYQYEVIGTVIPGASTLAEPSARKFTALEAVMREHKLCTIFAETTANEQLAQAVAAELADCDTVKIETIYTGAIGVAGSGMDSYIGMMMANGTAVVEGLK
jgi:zinc/manganese transport system substrate-binding protein/manganese/iron transport system substrate-binding protein